MKWLLSQRWEAIDIGKLMLEKPEQENRSKQFRREIHVNDSNGNKYIENDRELRNSKLRVQWLTDNKILTEQE